MHNVRTGEYTINWMVRPYEYENPCWLKER